MSSSCSRKLAVLPALLLSLQATLVISYAQPTNDQCSDATLLTVGQTITGSTVNASLDDDAVSVDRQCGSSTAVGSQSSSASPLGGVWYRFEGDGGPVTVSTCNRETNFDSRVRVFTGSSCANDTATLECVTENDNACGRRARAFVDTLAGESYWVVVYGSGESGSFQLDVFSGSEDDLQPVIPTSEGISLHDGVHLIEDPSAVACTDSFELMSNVDYDGGAILVLTSPAAVATCDHLWHVVLSSTHIGGGQFVLLTRAAGPAEVFSAVDLDLYDAPLTVINTTNDAITLLESGGHSLRLRDLLQQLSYEKTITGSITLPVNSANLPEGVSIEFMTSMYLGVSFRLKVSLENGLEILEVGGKAGLTITALVRYQFKEIPAIETPRIRIAPTVVIVIPGPFGIPIPIPISIFGQLGVGVLTDENDLLAVEGSFTATSEGSFDFRYTPEGGAVANSDVSFEPSGGVELKSGVFATSFTDECFSAQLEFPLTLRIIESIASIVDVTQFGSIIGIAKAEFPSQSDCECVEDTDMLEIGLRKGINVEIGTSIGPSPGLKEWIGEANAALVELETKATWQLPFANIDDDPICFDELGGVLDFLGLDICCEAPEQSYDCSFLGSTCMEVDDCDAVGGISSAGLCPEAAGASVQCCYQGYNPRVDRELSLAVCDAYDRRIFDCGFSYIDGSKSGQQQCVCADGRPISLEYADDYQLLYETFPSLRVVGGFRSMSEQEYFYKCHLIAEHFGFIVCNEGRAVQEPGYSKFQSGKTFQFAIDDSYPYTYEWLSENAHDLGFVRTAFGDTNQPGVWEFRPDVLHCDEFATSTYDCHTFEECGNCNEAHMTPSCDVSDLSLCVCTLPLGDITMQYCCTNEWDDYCADRVETDCGVHCKNEYLETSFPAEPATLPFDPENDCGECASTLEGPGCGSAVIEDCVCEVFPDCCTSQWSDLCVFVVPDFCNVRCPAPAPTPAPTPVPTEIPQAGDCGTCSVAHGSLGCSVPAIEECVCAVLPFCCEPEQYPGATWDDTCALLPSLYCGYNCDSGTQITYPPLSTEPPVDKDSCADRCFDFAHWSREEIEDEGACYCDDACYAIGDCCDDFMDTCAPGADSCENRCDSDDENLDFVYCQCQSFCWLTGSCCADYHETCDGLDTSL